MKLVRGFLYVIAFLTFLVVAIFFVMRIWADELYDFAFVPSGEFVEQQPLEVNSYHDPAMWLSRPGIGISDPARWQPAYSEEEGVAPPPTAASAAGGPTPPRFAVFFIHPTSYLEKEYWNAPLDDTDANERAALFLRGMASPFNQATEIWAPRYRQAAFGSFLTEEPQANRALDAAYRDIELAFDFFLDSVDPDMPIVLAGHSQGAVHLLRLLRSRIAGSELQPRIAMAYAVGWPVSIEHDMPALGLPACATPGQSACVMSWVSFAEPAEPEQMLKRYAASPGFDGKPRTGSPILCTNPINGIMGGSAPAQENLGTLVPDLDFADGKLVPQAVPARCREDGLLMIGDPPEMGAAVLPGNNYHVYDIPLFWANVQRDVVNRLRAWEAAK